jgi:hypothetical protein
MNISSGKAVSCSFQFFSQGCVVSARMLTRFAIARHDGESPEKLRGQSVLERDRQCPVGSGTFPVVIRSSAKHNRVEGQPSTPRKPSET